MSAAVSILLVGLAPAGAGLPTLGDRLVLRRVATVAEAVTVVRRSPPDCVLLDLAVPDAAGLDAVAALRHAAPAVPVVVVGGPEDEDLAVRALAAGAQDHVAGDEASPELVLRAVRYAMDRRATERELETLALTDALTGLPNRARLTDRVVHALERMPRTDGAVAVLLLDLDRFKLVNDSLGHSAGDRLLLAVAERLRRAVRPSDTVARFGGDEFVVLCEDLRDPSEAEIVVERIHRALGLPVGVDGHDVVPSASIGVALADGPDDSPERLLRDADAAMHRAKARGSGHARFAEEMRTGARERLALEIELHRAMRAREFEIHYQPLVVLADDRRVAGVEALVRWNHPERGLLLPDAFVGAAEETGLIRPLGAWVLREACAQLAAWDAEGVGGGELTMAVNLSPHQLADDAIVRIVEEVLPAGGIRPRRLCLEITESVLVDPAAGGPDRLRRLKELGVRIAMDDFGTGYASLVSLTAFPVDVLKIDRLFVRRMRVDDASRRIVAAVAALAQGLGLALVAEGVEHVGLAAELQQLGCEQAQGFAFGRPLPAGEVAAALRAAAPRVAADVAAI